MRELCKKRLRPVHEAMRKALEEGNLESYKSFAAVQQREIADYQNGAGAYSSEPSPDICRCCGATREKVIEQWKEYRHDFCEKRGWYQSHVFPMKQPGRVG